LEAAVLLMIPAARERSLAESRGTEGKEGRTSSASPSERTCVRSYMTARSLSDGGHDNDVEGGEKGVVFVPQPSRQVLSATVDGGILLPAVLPAKRRRM
jgi:hypothetical protein